jgi:hypothetical protein
MIQNNITPEMKDAARKELARRELARRQSVAVNIPQQSQQPQLSTIDKIAQSAPTQAILGAGDAMQRALSLGLMKPKTGSGTAYDVGQIGGDIMSYLLPAGAIRSGMKAIELAEASPEIVATASKYLGGEGLAGAMRRIAGSTAYGAATSPEDRAKGAGEGALLGGIGEALPGSFKLAGKATGFMRPVKTMNKILDASSDSNLAQKLAESTTKYSDVISKAGNNPIYDDISKSDYLKLTNKDINRVYDDGLQELNNKFLDNPNLENAHELQWQLGSKIGDLKIKKLRIGSLDAVDSNMMKSYHTARNYLKNDINSFLDKEPTLSDKYKEATQHFKDEVVPLRNANKLVNSFGRYVTPEKLATALNRAEVKKIPLPEDVSTGFDNLYSQIKNKKMARALVGGLAGSVGLGAITAHHIPLGMEIAGGLGGALASSRLGNLLDIGGSSASDLSKYLAKAYNPVKTAVISSLLNRGQ